MSRDKITDSARSSASGVHSQQPGSHLSVDTRLDQLKLNGSRVLRSAPPRMRSQFPRTTTSTPKPLIYQTHETPNFRVTSPFKQGPERKKINLKIPSPSEELKQKTTIAIRQTRSQLTMPKECPPSRIRVPKLWKGRLQPMGRPVTNHGPTMDKCQGIMAGARNVVSSQGSRFYDVQTPLVDGTVRPASASSFLRGDSSIHQTSCASSDSSKINREEDFSEDESGSDGDVEDTEDILGLSPNPGFDDFSRVKTPKDDDVHQADLPSLSDEEELDEEEANTHYNDVKLFSWRKDNDDGGGSCGNGRGDRGTSSRDSAGRQAGAGVSNGSGPGDKDGCAASSQPGYQNKLQEETLFLVIKSGEITQSKQPGTDDPSCDELPAERGVQDCLQISSMRTSLSHDNWCMGRSNSLPNLHDSGADSVTDMDADRIPCSRVWEALADCGLSRDEIISGGMFDSVATDHLKELPPRPPSGYSRRHVKKTKKNKKRKSKGSVSCSTDQGLERQLRIWLSGYFSQQLEDLEEVEVGARLSENKFRQYVENYMKNQTHEENEPDNMKLVTRSCETEVQNYDIDKILESARKTFYITRAYDEEKSSESEEEEACVSEQFSKALEDSPGCDDKPEETPSRTSSPVVEKQDEECERPAEHSSSELKIQATVKPLQLPRGYQDCESASLFPVCFRLNASPPPGHLYYFAYGADMSVDRMSVYLRRDVDKQFWGILFGLKLVFNKRGHSLEAGGFPNVELSQGDSVEGCVYTITEAELSLLDQSVGYPLHYARVVLPAWIVNCDGTGDLGVAQYCVPVVLYVAQDKWTVSGSWGVLECSYNAKQCMKAGKHILSPSYLQSLSVLVDGVR